MHYVLVVTFITSLLGVSTTHKENMGEYVSISRCESMDDPKVMKLLPDGAKIVKYECQKR